MSRPCLGVKRGGWEALERRVSALRRCGARGLRGIVRETQDFPIDYNDMIDQLHEKELAEEEARKKAMKMRGEALDEEMLDDDTDVTDDLLSEPAAEDDDAGLGSDLIVDEEDFN
jgi:hypothetical protein